MLYNDEMLVRLLALSTLLFLVSCQFGVQYADFWEDSRTAPKAQTGAISLEKLQKQQASLSIVLRKGYFPTGLDLTTRLQYDDRLAWCIMEYVSADAVEGKQSSTKKQVSDKVALALFQAASQLPCMGSSKSASSSASPLELSLSYQDSVNGSTFFYSQDCEDKMAAHLDLFIQMRAAMAPAKPLELSHASFQELMQMKPSATKMRKLYQLNPLMAAIEMGDEKGAAKLMQAAMKTGYILSYVNQTNAYGKTALHYACRTGQGEIVADLLASGASVDLRDHAGTTPMMLARQYGYAEIVQQLIAAGAN